VFGEQDERYFRLISRANDMSDEVDWSCLDMSRVFEAFRRVFGGGRNIDTRSYFDKMTRFDFECLLPGLLHIEDRMTMAHGLESRMPLLDHPVIELAASMPAAVRFDGGRPKHILKVAFADLVPEKIIQRRDKMGFPVPLREWYGKEIKDFVNDTFGAQAAKARPFMRGERILANLSSEAPFSRKTWGLLSLEIWHQTFHDRAAEWKAMIQ